MLYNLDPGQPHAGPPVPGPLLPRLHVQGRHRQRSGSQTGKVTNDDPVYPLAEQLHPAPDRPGHLQLRRRGRAAARSPRSCGCRATPPSPRWAGHHRGRATWSPAPVVGLQPRRPHRPARPRPSRCSPPTSANNPPKLAQASIGQNDVQATPLQMALVAAGGGQRRHHHEAAPHDRGPRQPGRRSSRPTSPRSG